jgi:putative addiction module CopG family antidote
MRNTQHMSIRLPGDMAQIVKAKVATGEYASQSEVMRDGLRSLWARDRAVEHWGTSKWLLLLMHCRRIQSECCRRLRCENVWSQNFRPTLNLDGNLHR